MVAIRRMVRRDQVAQDGNQHKQTNHDKARHGKLVFTKPFPCHFVKRGAFLSRLVLDKFAVSPEKVHDLHDSRLWYVDVEGMVTSYPVQV